MTFTKETGISCVDYTIHCYKNSGEYIGNFIIKKHEFDCMSESEQEDLFIKYFNPSNQK